MLVELLLLLSFFQIGLLGVGGDEASLAFLEYEVIERWGLLSPSQLADLMVVSKMAPGGIFLHTATLSGYMASAPKAGFWGIIGTSFLCVAALSLPAFIWANVVDFFSKRRPTARILSCMLALLRPLLPGLIASAAILLMTSDNFGSPSQEPWRFGVSIFLFLSTLVGVGIYRIHPLFMVILCGLSGLLLL